MQSGPHIELYECIKKGGGKQLRAVRLTVVDNAYKGELLRSELSLMGNMDHPNLIQKVKVYQEDNNYFVMQEHGPVLKDQILAHLHTFSEIKVVLIVK